uniref:Calicivirus coat protein domain-containing protein n=1 Tax=Picornavirales sp. TaxID=1955153 RepID=A0A6M3YU16_9VIRU|nr:MAG: hypothetical protein 2 [Picornavirales sp.]
MSQSHIPQPNAVGAPSEEVLSTDSAQRSPTVSGIGVPGPSPIEAPTHVGAHNAIDPTLYVQQIFCATFPWTTKDQPGKLLFKMRVTPREINKIMALLSRIYNSWSGGFEFMVKVAGTGFHAGALTLVRFPPNIDPDVYSGTKDWSAFEWVLFDPKMLEVASITIRDQRPTNYHYVVPENETPSSWDIAGYLGVFVDMSLNTSSSGSQSIQVQLWARPAPDFQFLQLIIPQDVPSRDTALIPAEIASALDFSKAAHNVTTCASFPYTPDKVIIAPQSVKTVSHGIFNTFQLDGTSNSKYQIYNEFRPPGFQFTGLIGDNSISFPAGYWDTTPPKGSAALMFNSSGVTGAFNFKEAINDDWSGSVDAWHESDFPKNTYTEVYVRETSALHFYSNDNSYSAKTDKESFIKFQAVYNSNLTTIQTSEMARVFQSGAYAKWIPNGMCALFTMIDTSENLPIAFCKLYKEGFLTTSASSDQNEYPITNIRFVFSNFIQRTDALPTNPDYATRKMILDLKYRALSKRSSRKHKQ